MIRVSVSYPDVKRLIRDLNDAIDASLEDVAREIPGILADLYYTGMAPDGTPNKNNDASTIEQKTSKLGHSISLLGKGEILTDTDLYIINEADNGWEISPPPERQGAVLGLRDKGYRVHEIPPEARDVLEQILKERIADIVVRQLER